uniref:SPRY-associated domain-containing protein n=1 Tax=Amphilophus citrinellus TaxID=61819 RepID=A0A3Q0STY8_AMPCI
MDEHKGHDTVSAAAERKEKQKKQRFQQGIQEKEKQLRQLSQSSSDAAVDQNEKAYAEIVLMADKRRCAVNDLIRDQEKAAVSRSEAAVDLLKKEISELRKREDELKRLSLTEDNVHFLQFDFVTKALSDLRDKMENMSRAIGQISETQVDPDPKTREEFSMSCCLTLDPNTAFENLLLSEGNTKVTWIKKPQRYPYHPERFTKYDQVLCTEGLSGICYWEVEWRGPRVEVAVCY